MKTLFILSDTHGNAEGIKKLLPIMEENDYVIHLGDYITDARYFTEKVYEKLYAVKGNCDGGGEDLVVEIEDKKILLTHGDRYGVKQGNLKLLYKAKELGADAVFYGHTHSALVEEVDGITIVNPGTLSKYSDKTYCYAVVSNGKIIAKIVNVI